MNMKKILSAAACAAACTFLLSACSAMVSTPFSANWLKTPSNYSADFYEELVYSVAFGGDAIAVDTHVFRVSNRLGLAKGKTPAEVEDKLHRAVPKKDWSKAHHWLIYHGRRVCHSRNPVCANCTLARYCDYNNLPAKKKKALLEKDGQID